MAAAIGESKGLGFYRPAWMEIRWAALERNYLTLKNHLVSKSCQVLAVVKANAYGHGAVEVARRLEFLGARFFGVSSIEEGIALRESGLEGRILLLGSAYPFRESFEACLRHRLIATISSLEGARQLARFMGSRDEPAGVHLKMETGMQRIGARPETCVEILKTLAEAPNVRCEGVYTHLASARDQALTRAQLAEFERGLTLLFGQGPRPLVHAANSAATVRAPEAQLDLVRPGLALYGQMAGFEPIMTIKTRIVFLKKVPVGTRVSYEGTYITSRPTVLATLPIGYGDGLPMAASGKAHVLIAGKPAPVAGLITMDMMMVDVTDAGPVYVGDEVVVAGPQGQERVAPADWAKWGKTSVYQFLCGLGVPRLPKVYL